VASLPFLRGTIFLPCHKLPENRKEKAVAVQEIKTDESYTVIVSDGKKQSTVTVTKDGIYSSVGATNTPFPQSFNG